MRGTRRGVKRPASPASRKVDWRALLGQTFRHSPQPVQTETKFFSGRAPGGRMSRLFFSQLSVCRGLVLMARAEKAPKARDPTTYLRERETPSAVFHRGRWKPKAVASGGQSRHWKQEMQSCWRYCRGVS